MDKTTKNFLMFPGPERWETWSSTGDHKSTRIERPDSRAPGFDRSSRRPRILALPSACFYTLPLWVFARNEEELRNAAEIQLEKEGLLRPNETARFDYDRVLQENNRILLRIDALGGDELILQPDSLPPDRICLSPCLLPLPDDRIVIWKELGRFVAAMAQNGKLFFQNVIPSPRLDSQAAEEILRWSKQFQFQGMISPLKGVILWTETGDLEAMGERMDLPVTREPMPSPRLNDRSTTQMLPPSVDSLLIGQTRRRKTQRRVATAAGAIGLVSLGLVVTFMLEIRKGRRLAAEIAELTPAASEIQRIQQRWDEVSPAVDADSSPLEMMLLIRGLPSAREVQIEEFALNSITLALSGKASSPAEALKFLGSVSKSERLAHYEWSYPQPLIDPDGSASFEIEGSLPDQTP